MLFIIYVQYFDFYYIILPLIDFFLNNNINNQFSLCQIINIK